MSWESGRILWVWWSSAGNPVNIVTDPSRLHSAVWRVLLLNFNSYSGYPTVPPIFLWAHWKSCFDSWSFHVVSRTLQWSSEWIQPDFRNPTTRAWSYAWFSVLAYSHLGIWFRGRIPASLWFCPRRVCSELVRHRSAHRVFSAAPGCSNSSGSWNSSSYFCRSTPQSRRTPSQSSATSQRFPTSRNTYLFAFHGLNVVRLEPLQVSGFHGLHTLHLLVEVFLHVVASPDFVLVLG